MYFEGLWQNLTFYVCGREVLLSLISLHASKVSCDGGGLAGGIGKCVSHWDRDHFAYTDDTIVVGDI